MIGFHIIALVVSMQTGKVQEPDRKVLARFGTCLVSNDRAASIAADYVRDLDVETRKLHRGLPFVPCWEALAGQSGAQLHLPGYTLRYILSEALLRKQSGVFRPSSFETIAPLPYPGLTRPTPFKSNGKPLRKSAYAEALQQYEQGQRDVLLARSGECVVRTDPAAALAFLRTSPESQEEATHFSTTAAALGRCLQTASPPEVGKLELRGSVALAYFRLANAAAQMEAAK